MIITVQRHVCLDHAWHEWVTRLSFQNGFHRSIMKEFIFFTHFCDCSVKTELIYRSYCAKNKCNRFLVGTIVDRQFSATFALELTLWTMDSWLGRLGVRFLRVIPSSFLPCCPIHLVLFSLIEYHLFFLNQDREMTIVLLRIEKRVEHLKRILSCCPSIPIQCRWTLTWRWSNLWTALYHSVVLSWILECVREGQMLWILTNIFHSNSIWWNIWTVSQYVVDFFLCHSCGVRVSVCECLRTDGQDNGTGSNCVSMYSVHCRVSVDNKSEFYHSSSHVDCTVWCKTRELTNVEESNTSLCQHSLVPKKSLLSPSSFRICGLYKLSAKLVRVQSFMLRLPLLCYLPLHCFLQLLFCHDQFIVQNSSLSTIHWFHSTCTSVSMFTINVDKHLLLCSWFLSWSRLYLCMCRCWGPLHLVGMCGIHEQQNTNPANVQCCNTEAETGFVSNNCADLRCKHLLDTEVSVLDFFLYPEIPRVNVLRSLSCSQSIRERIRRRTVALNFNFHLGFPDLGA